MGARAVQIQELGPAPPAKGGLRTLFGARKPELPVLPAGTRCYAIGDVHGRLDLLDTLLAAIRDDDAARGGGVETEVVLLGDLIDRGPDSAGVVRRAMAGLDWAKLAVLLGNHEHAMLEALDGDRSMARLWLSNGGEAALLSWGLDPVLVADAPMNEVMAVARTQIPAAERAWLAQRPLSLQRGDYYFVHAGIRPGVALDRQVLRDALWIRDEFLDSQRHHGVFVIHGHSIEDDVEERSNRIGLDTGAFQSGKLTALGLEAGHRWLFST